MVVGNGSSAFRAARGKPSAVVGQAPLLRRILFRQSGEDRQLFQILLDRSCGRSPEDYALSTNYFLTGNPALRSKNGSILDAHVVRDSDLPANDDIILYHCAAGETCLRRDHNVLADIDVVSHMHQVIDFCAAANAGEIERAAIDGGIRANLHVIFDDKPSDLRELFVVAGFRVSDIAEAVASKHGSSVNHNSVAKFGARIDGDVGIDATIASNLHLLADNGTCSDSGSFADLHIFGDNNPFLDHYIFSQFRGLVYDRARRHVWNVVALRVKPGSGTRKGEPRLGGASHR